MQVLDRRRAGVLLHPTSLPGPFEFGVLGSEARRFVDLIAAAGFTIWQTLPLGPVDWTLSPYQLKSAFAGNPALIDERETGVPAATDARSCVAFIRRNRRWLLPYALFEALRACYQDKPWWDWPAPLRDREPTAIRRVLVQERAAVRRTISTQFLFELQWRALRSYAAGKGVSIFGDLPFYVDLDSADVWWHRPLFQLDADGRPTAVAGVPPDYFSADGQLWGNPLYDWQQMRANGFRWWQERIEHQLERFDLLRIDHFRALESCWAVPAGASTAREGAWRPVPGRELLSSLRERLGSLPLVAEDLGIITPAVEALRDEFDLPGMLVLQFAFDGSDDNPYLPARHRENAVVYTGTHDNDTTVGWYSSLDPQSRDRVRQVLGDDRMPDALIRAACESPARLAIIPMQDLLGLGSEARMNTPGTTSGNWRWRFEWGDVPVDLADRYLQLIDQNGRKVSD